jgi:hypothetical protein
MRYQLPFPLTPTAWAARLYCEAIRIAQAVNK